MLQIWSRSLKEYYEKCFVPLEQTKSFCNETARGTHVTLVCWFLCEITQIPPKHKRLFNQSFSWHSFWGSYGWDQHMSPNTHIVPNKIILSGAFRQRVSLQRTSSSTWKKESYHMKVCNKMSSPDLSDSHCHKDQGLKEAPHNNPWVGVLIDGAMNAVPNLWRVLKIMP